MYMYMYYTPLHIFHQALPHLLMPCYERCFPVPKGRATQKPCHETCVLSLQPLQTLEGNWTHA